VISEKNKEKKQKGFMSISSEPVSAQDTSSTPTIIRSNEKSNPGDRMFFWGRSGYYSI
jgi:hypothetical protein